MKKETKWFLGEVVAKGKNVPDFGLGKGVLMSQECGLKDEHGRGFDSATFAAALLYHADRLLKEAVEVRWTEVKKKKK